MIHSMTGFARQTLCAKGVTLTWEIRSVNHRYLDINVRLPDLFRHLEFRFREQVNQYLGRGKVDLTLNYQAEATLSNAIVINQAMVNQVQQACSAVSELMSMPQQTLTPFDVLNWPGVAQEQNPDLSSLEPDIERTLDQALNQLIQVRKQEGEKLQQLLQQRNDMMKHEVEVIRDRIGTINQTIRDQIVQKVKQLQVDVDHGRMEQEIALQLRNIDITEEIERLQAHLYEVDRLLKQGGVCGRRLDFLMQELLREANTIGSKSIDQQTSASVVELKVLIEQMREQIQNIE